MHKVGGVEKMSFNKTTYDNNYQRENYDRIALNVKKGEKEKIKKYAEIKGYDTITEYIKAILYEDMEKNQGGGDISE